MKRIIIDYNKLSEELKALFLEKYPEGYSINDMITFKNTHGETIETIELKTEVADYLVKIDKNIIPEIESISDEAYDYYISANQNEMKLSVNQEGHEDIDEFENEIEDDSSDIFTIESE